MMAAGCRSALILLVLELQVAVNLSEMVDPVSVSNGSVQIVE